MSPTTSASPQILRFPGTDTPELLARTRLPAAVFATSEQVGIYVAREVADLIRQRNAAAQTTVLGLPTGSTPIGVYRELIRLHREEGLDLSRVVSFNLDEYWPMDPKSIHSYHRWMRENFFDHVNIPDGNIHIPKGDLKRHEIETFCQRYEAMIAEAGGIDIQLLGIGRTGHIGFNEPGSERDCRTRMFALDPVTRRDAASGFFGEEHVPYRAVTMGVGTILDARRLILIALGEHKSLIIRRTLEESQNEQVVASFLQAHKNAMFVLDKAAAACLTAVKTPWVTRRVDWNLEMERRAVIWLCRQTKKPLLKLEAKDFMEQHLTDLVHESGGVEGIRQRVFDHLNQTICTEPGGPTPQTVLVFSPHPDDDVISMGGTLINLASRGHEVQIAYMTSGNIAVFDHDALRHLDYVMKFLGLFGLQTPASCLLEQRIRQSVARKTTGDIDIDEVLAMKGLIRRTEAIAAAQTAGVSEERCHFLDLPFYKTGQVEKKPIGPEDVAIIAALLRKWKPAQIYVAGDLSDPHGTHRMCAQAITEALRDVKADGIEPEVWLYRGAWQEYEPHEIERVVPLSPEVMLRKKQAIFKHESQKDAALFPGHDEREFWVRAEERTRNTARIFNELGLAEHYALEAFKRFDGVLS